MDDLNGAWGYFPCVPCVMVLGGVFSGVVAIQAHSGEHATIHPRKGPIRRTDARCDGRPPGEGVACSPYTLAMQASKSERLIGQPRRH